MSDWNPEAYSNDVSMIFRTAMSVQVRRSWGRFEKVLWEIGLENPGWIHYTAVVALEGE